MLLALLLAAQATTPASVPQRNPDQPPNQTMMVEPIAMLLASFDADEDGRTTRAEARAGIDRSFAMIDTGGKGSIGYIQYGQWAARFLGDANALPSPFEVDTDHDNRITRAEMEAEIDDTFTRLDRNHDNVLTRDELLTIRTGFLPYGQDSGHRRRR